MANIQPYTDQIRTARYGEQVRGSIVNALEAMNDDINDDTQSAGAYAQQAEASAQNATQTASDLSSTLTQIETDMEAYDAAEQARDTAEQERASAEIARQAAEIQREDTESGYVAQARTYAQTAEQHASSDNATLSRSWAEGNTGYRDGEDLNNAKYWAQQARQAAYGEAVISFNGRSGSVVPMADDYAASQITRGTGTVESSLSAIEANVSAKTAQINDLIAMDTPARSDLAMADGITASVWTIKLNKYGGFCILQINVNITSTIARNVETVIATLPEDARPIIGSYAIITPQNVSDQTILFSIKANGDITVNPRLRDHTQSDGFFRLSIAYPISYRGGT